LVLTPAIKARTEFAKYTGKRKKWLGFFGVYALYNGKLIELQSHPQTQYAISGMTVMGLVGGGSSKRKKLQNSFHLTNKSVVMNYSKF
jgi:hypothetical protein